MSWGDKVGILSWRATFMGMRWVLCWFAAIFFRHALLLTRLRLW